MAINKLYFVGGILGGLAGFLYWNYIGCSNGSCAITSSPYRSIIYFALMGSVFLGIFQRRQPTK